jgi:ABC-type bacteriocin/lantibiotic exporter with double-glycine peptidase domain
MLSAISVCLELAAMTALMPLASLSAGKSAMVDGVLVRMLRFLDLPTDGRTILLVFVGLFAARVLTQFVSQGLTIYLGKRILLQLNTRAFSAIICHVPIRELESKSIGYFISLAGDEASRASNLVIFVSQFLSTALLGVLYFAAIVTYSRIVAYAVVLFLVVTFVVLFESFRISHRLGIQQIEQSQAANSFFVDAINGLRSIRSYSVEDYITAGHFSQMLSYMHTLVLIDITSISARLGPVLFLFLWAAVAALWPGASGSLSVDLPFLVTVIILLMRFFPTVGQGLNLALRVIADARAGRDITQIIDQYQYAPVPASPAARISGVIEKITVVGVDFEHLDGKPVLQGLTIAMSKGRSYALVGVSGSGKSTFLDLLLGFYSPSKGSIFIDDIPLSSIAPSDFRGKIVLVAQDATIFNDTVKNNLCLGLELPQRDVERACRIACIDEFITELPEGYDTVLNYKGTNFSGGQKQRIGIARALLRNPEVLLLDESTSALDPTTREKLVQNLLEEFRSRIILFVTHDAFVMSRVDEILHLSPAHETSAVKEAAACVS